MGVPLPWLALGWLCVMLTSIPIHFSPPGNKRWLRPSPVSRWRWTGDAELHFDGNDTILRGCRARPFMHSTPQELRFASSDVLDVETTDKAVRCKVRRAASKAEPLAFWTDSADIAKAIALRWPKEQSVAFQERTAFNQALTKVETRVVITPALIAVNVLIFVVMVIAGVDFMRPSGAALISWGSNYGPKTLDGQWWRLLTSMFLHSGLIHLLLNMWVLASLGPLTERLFGTVRYLLLYVFAGLFGSVASLLWNPLVNSAGASGAIMGVLGGLVAFVINPRTETPETVSSAQRNSGLVFVAYNLVYGFSHAGIDSACHIGGLVSGFAMGWVLARPLDNDTRTHEGPGLLIGLTLAVAVLLTLSFQLPHSLSEKQLAPAAYRRAEKAATHSRAPETPVSACALQYVKGSVVLGYCSGALIAPDKFLSTQICEEGVPPGTTIKVACGSESPVGIKKRATPIGGYNSMMKPFTNEAANLNAVRSMVVYTLQHPLKAQPATVELDPDSFAYNSCIMAGVGGTGLAKAYVLKEVGKYSQYSQDNLFIASEPIAQPGDGGAPVYCRNHENIFVLRAIYVVKSQIGDYYARLDANEAFLREALEN
jgi:membrane associated rhomboid family serine protease